MAFIIAAVVLTLVVLGVSTLCIAALKQVEWNKLTPAGVKARERNRKLDELKRTMKMLYEKSIQLPLDDPRQELIKTYHALCYDEYNRIIQGKEDEDWQQIESSAREVLEVD